MVVLPPLIPFYRHQQGFPDEMWLDGLFMAEPFYAKWTHQFDNNNQTAWNDILKQYDLIETFARNHTSGLLPHGWADSDKAPWADPATGLAPHVWGRAVGWYFMSLVEVLQVYPQSHYGYDKLFLYYTSLAEALKAARDEESGSWWQVMDEPYPGQEGNFIEASASAMFTYGMLKGIDLGYLGREDFLEVAKDSYLSLVENFVVPADNGTLILEGTVDECNLANGDVNYEVSFSLTSRPLCGHVCSDTNVTHCSTTPVGLSSRTTRTARVRLCLLLLSGSLGPRTHE